MKKIIFVALTTVLMNACSSYKINNSSFEMKSGTIIKCNNCKITQAPTIIYLNEKGLHIEIKYKNLKKINVNYE